MSIASVLNLENPVAEETVLAAMRDDTGLAVHMMEHLTEDCFSSPERKTIFLGLNHLLMGIDPIDATGIARAANMIAKERKLKVTISPEMVQGLTGGNTQAISYVDTLTRFSWLRNMGDFAYWMVGELQRAQDPTALFAAANEKLTMLQPKTNTQSNFVYGWDTGEYQKAAIASRINERNQGKRVLYDYPWHSWNETIAPLSGGMIGTLYGPTKAGKSTFYDMIAEHWATLGHVVFVHLEDDLQYKLNRRNARHSTVPYLNIAAGDLSDFELHTINQCELTIQSTFGPYLHYFHAPGATMSDICREIEHRREEGVCDAVVIDYLGKIAPSRMQVQLFGSNIWERQANDFEILKSSCEKKIRGKSIPGFTGDQFTKDGQDGEELSLKLIAGSGQKLNKAQMIALFNRKIVGDDGLWDSRHEKQLARPGSKSPFIDFLCAAQNQGDTGKWQMLMDGPRFRIKDMPTTKPEDRIDLNNF